MDKDKARYDITMVRKGNDEGYQVYTIYNNEDNEELTPILWTSHHYWYPESDGTLNKFINEVEITAYIDEDFKSLEEVFGEFRGKFIFFNSETEIEEYINKNTIDYDTYLVCIKL